MKCIAILLGLLLSVDAFGQGLLINRFVNQTAGAGGGAYTPNTTYFAGDGQCHLERDATLWASSVNQFYVSVWLKPDSSSGTIDGIFAASDDGVRIYFNPSDQFVIDMEDAANTQLVQLRSTAAITRNGSTWTHIFVRIDRTTDNQGEVYVNGSLSTTITTFLSTAEDADPPDLDNAETCIGALGDTSLPYGGCMADLWISTGNTYSGITVGDFISAGRPVDLGANGSNPDGTQPGVFLKGNGTGFTVNSGTRGDFFKKGTTPLTTCSTGP